MRASVVFLIAITLGWAPLTPAVDVAKPSAERGGQAVRTLPLSPPVLPVSAYDSLWRQWGAREKPADYDRAVRDRYGLLPGTAAPNQYGDAPDVPPT